jgi:hypothetical protein
MPDICSIMATNKSVIELLERLADILEEANAINKVLKKHIAAQKALGGKDIKKKYRYNKDKKVYERVIEVSDFIK